MPSLARWCLRRRWLVLAGWVLALVLLRREQGHGDQLRHQVQPAGQPVNPGSRHPPARLPGRFGWGLGSSAFGLSGSAPVEVFLPVIMFSVLFGLSMDYEVFLVSRIREEWIRTGDNRAAVTTGQTVTGRVITAAASIMILVFVSFLLVDNIIIRQFGVGLAAAVFVDAFVVRTVLVPTLMHLCGRANWWLPRWLDRLLPHVAIDVPQTRVTEKASRYSASVSR
jgi:putative drug exporter of the RND superfamily